MHYTINIDRQNFVCMRDTIEDHLLFAVDREQLSFYTELVVRYNCEPEELPDCYTLEVIRLTEIADYVYTLGETCKCRYQVNHLDFALTLPFQGAVAQA